MPVDVCVAVSVDRPTEIVTQTGLIVEDCIEEPFSDEQIANSPAALVFPQAARAAMTGLASVWVWVVRTS